MLNLNKDKIMKNVIWVFVAVVALAAMCIFVGMGVKNTAINYEEVIKNADADIRTEEKRRFDLIPNLVDCVKQYDEHEYNTLKDVIAARTAGGNAADIEEVKAMIAAVAEAYPDLKSQKNYQELMNELSITENRISNLRKDYNKQVTKYKRYIRVFPSKQILSLVGYEEQDYERLSFENSSVDAPKNLFDKE